VFLEILELLFGRSDAACCGTAALSMMRASRSRLYLAYDLLADAKKSFEFSIR